MNKSEKLNEGIPERLQYEHRLWNQQYTRIMGLDEVGRGCLSGPVVAAGVIFEPDTFINEIRDSKQLNLNQRKELTEYIKDEAEFWTIQWCSPQEIDKLNILHASIKAMCKCAEDDGGDPDFLLVDGNRFSAGIYPYQCIVKGDDRSMSIAAASILAKVYRDELMIKLHDDYPYYGWDTNVGYPTAKHYQGLKEYGITPYHRRSFNLKTEKIYHQSNSS